MMNEQPDSSPLPPYFVSPTSSPLEQKQRRSNVSIIRRSVHEEDGHCHHHSSHSHRHHHHSPIEMEILGNYWPRIVLTGPPEELFITTADLTNSTTKNRKNQQQHQAVVNNSSATPQSPSTAVVKRCIKIPRRGLKHVNKHTKELLAKATTTTTPTRSATPSPVNFNKNFNINKNNNNEAHDWSNRLITPSFVNESVHSPASPAAAASFAGVPPSQDTTTPMVYSWPNRRSRGNTGYDGGYTPIVVGPTTPTVSSLTGKVLHLSPTTPASAGGVPFDNIQPHQQQRRGSQLIPSSSHGISSNCKTTTNKNKKRARQEQQQQQHQRKSPRREMTKTTKTNRHDNNSSNNNSNMKATATTMKKDNITPKPTTE